MLKNPLKALTPVINQSKINITLPLKNFASHHIIIWGIASYSYTAVVAELVDAQR